MSNCKKTFRDHWKFEYILLGDIKEFFLIFVICDNCMVVHRDTQGKPPGQEPLGPVSCLLCPLRSHHPKQVT